MGEGGGAWGQSENLQCRNCHNGISQRRTPKTLLKTKFSFLILSNLPQGCWMVGSVNLFWGWKCIFRCASISWHVMSKFWNLVEILKFGWNPEICLKFWNFLKDLKKLQKIWNLVDFFTFGKNSEIWLISWNLVWILKFGLFSEIWLIFWNLVDFLKFG